MTTTTTTTAPPDTPGALCAQCTSPRLVTLTIPTGHRPNNYTHCHDCGHTEPAGRAHQ